MIAYKGFNKDLSCTLGKGIYKYEVGKTYEETEAQCARTGFHCVEEPLEVLRWYSSDDSRYCVVDAIGDVHEDGQDKISCTEMKIVKEVSLEQLYALECRWIMEHPERTHSGRVQKNEGVALANECVIVRGKYTKAKGEIGATLYLLKEGKGTKEIVEAGAYKIDGKEYMPNVYYNVSGRAVRCVKKN